MSMYEWPDDELDDLFRQSGEKADPATNPQDWQQLSERLPGHDQTRWTTKIVRWMIPVILLLLLSTVGIIAYLNPHVTGKNQITGTFTQSKTTGSSSRTYEQDVSQPFKGQEVDSPATTSYPAKPEPLHENNPVKQSVIMLKNRDGQTRRVDQPEIGRSLITSKQVKTLSVKKLADTNSADQDLLINRAADKNKRLALWSVHRQSKLINTKFNARTLVSNQPYGKQVKRDSLVLAVKWVENQSNVSIEIKQARKADGVDDPPVVKSDQLEGQRIHHNANPDAPYDDSTTRSGIEQRAKEQALATIHPNVSSPAYLLAKQAKWPVAPGSLPVIRPLETSATGLSVPQPRLSRLSVQVVVAPDLSAIGFHNFDRPGSNVGVMGQYQLTNRFSLQTGALWSTKQYTTLAAEYVWPASAPAKALRPESVTGRCTMFDIPINLRYDVLLRPTGTNREATGMQRMAQQYHRWFVSGGVTSYFINHEAYTYNYANPADPTIKRTSWDNKVEGKPGGSFGLSAINVSIGYERPVSQRFSLQIEPFVKLPVRQIGYFNVHLLSTGAFLSLRYRL